LVKLFLLQATLHLRPAALAQRPKKALWLPLLLNKRLSLIAFHSKIYNSGLKEAQLKHKKNKG
jgi:hypothetical protein